MKIGKKLSQSENVNVEESSGTGAGGRLNGVVGD